MTVVPVPRQKDEGLAAPDIGATTEAIVEVKQTSATVGTPRGWKGGGVWRYAALRINASGVAEAN